MAAERQTKHRERRKAENKHYCENMRLRRRGQAHDVDISIETEGRRRCLWSTRSDLCTPAYRWRSHAAEPLPWSGAGGILKLFSPPKRVDRAAEVVFARPQLRTGGFA